MIGHDQWLVIGDEECQVPVEDRFSFYRFASEDSHKSTSHRAAGCLHMCLAGRLDPSWQPWATMGFPDRKGTIKL